MSKKAWIGWVAFLFVFSAILQASDSKWTGIFYRNGDPSSFEEGGPFATAKDCFQWGKSKRWTDRDQIRCGSGCTKDANGNLGCEIFETEESYQAGADGSKNSGSVSSGSGTPRKVLVS